MTAGEGRHALVAANWKMHLLRGEAEAYCRSFRQGYAGPPPEVVLFPTFVLIPAVAFGLEGSQVAVGAQDIHTETHGAHTGDVSGAQIRDAGCRWVLCGHSERRRDHGEDDTVVARKAAAAVQAGLMPMVCVGESAQQRHQGRTLTVLERQLRAVTGALAQQFALAYEPVWAIGTGETATPEIAQEAQRHLRQLLVDLFDRETAARTRVLYGGSVKPDNAAALIAQPDIDGFLVGGASLKATEFLAIIEACR